MVRSSQPLKRKSQSPPPAKPSQPTNQPSQQAAFIVVDDDATAESAELAEEYNAFLANERNEILREKQANERLSHSLENHVIEEAKVILNLLRIKKLQFKGVDYLFMIEAFIATFWITLLDSSWW